MSIEIILYPKSATKKQLCDHLASNGFIRCGHLWDWPEGSFSYSWFEERDYLSFDGVEATVYPPDKKERREYSENSWALHTRTRISASVADQRKQNDIIRSARRKFGGVFINDTYGKNRYIQLEDDGRDASARGIYLSYEYVKHKLSAVKFAIPNPTKNFDNFKGTNLEVFAELDPVRILYNALVPFALAAIEHFFGHVFTIMLKYDMSAQSKLKSQTRKLDMKDAVEISQGKKTIEDVIASWYSFQSINSIHAAFKDWFDIDFWGMIRRRKKIGKRIPFLEQRFKEIIEFRHGIIHRFEFNLQLDKAQITEVLDLALVLIELFVDHMEKSKGMVIRD